MAQVTLNLDDMTATVTPRVVDKYARQLVQKQLKTILPGYWTVWYEPTLSDDTTMHFTITNPIYSTKLFLGAWD